MDGPLVGVLTSVAFWPIKRDANCTFRRSLISKTSGESRNHANAHEGAAIEAMRPLESASGPIAAPDVCDGTSAVGESRHRIPGASTD